jgi:hypothetical protein
LIMKIGPLPGALEPGFHCVRTQWIRGFMGFRGARKRSGSGVSWGSGWPGDIHPAKPGARVVRVGRKGFLQPRRRFAAPAG